MILLKIIGISIGVLFYFIIGILTIKKLAEQFLLEIEGEDQFEFIFFSILFPIVVLYIIAREISNYIINHGRK